MHYAGICEVKPTPKGWFIKNIDRDSETIKRQAVRRLLATQNILFVTSSLGYGA